jgi:hypothetical protein
MKDRATMFMAIARGIPAHRVARACNKLTPGINYNGCSKRDMAYDFANWHMKDVSEKDLAAAINRVEEIHKANRGAK